MSLETISLSYPCWTIVDTGIGNVETRSLCPDHAGNAAWLCSRYGAELWTTQGEYLTAHAVRTSSAGYTADAVLSVFRKNGLDEERAARMRGPRNRYAELVPEFPLSYRRIIEGDEISIGKHRWRAIVGHGHAPEHLSLFCEGLNTVVAGDMLLSTISTNVSVWSIDPEGDPLRLFLGSIARYRELPDDVLVLPSHGKSAAELLGVLFRRPLDTHQTFFAMGEAIAHLHYLYYSGRARRALGNDGIMRYATRR